MAESVCEYAAPTVPLGSEAVVIESGAGFTMRVNCRGAAPLTATVNIKEPAWVGVPESTPAALKGLRPGGKVPLETDQV